MAVQAAMSVMPMAGSLIQIARQGLTAVPMRHVQAAVALLMTVHLVSGVTATVSHVHALITVAATIILGIIAAAAVTTTLGTTTAAAHLKGARRLHVSTVAVALRLHLLPQEAVVEAAVAHHAVVVAASVEVNHN